MTHELNTPLSPEELAKYAAWVESQGIRNPTYDYDLQGAWKELMSGEMQQGANKHFGDKYKKPNHPTFSDQSQYSNFATPGGHWSQNRIPEKVQFDPSYVNVENMGEQGLRDYFQKVEPENVVNLPSEGPIIGDR